MAVTRYSISNHPVTWPDHISSVSLKTRIMAGSDATMHEISYSIRLSFCHSTSFHTKLTIRSVIQTDRKQTGYQKESTVWKDDRTTALLPTVHLFIA